MAEEKPTNYEKYHEAFENYLKLPSIKRYKEVGLMFVKFEFNKNKIKFKFYIDAYNKKDIERLTKKGWLCFNVSNLYNEQYDKLGIKFELLVKFDEDGDAIKKESHEDIDTKITFTISEDLENVYCGDDYLLNKSTKITKIELGSRWAKWDRSVWKITVQDLSKLTCLTNIQNTAINILKSTKKVKFKF